MQFHVTGGARMHASDRRLGKRSMITEVQWCQFDVHGYLRLGQVASVEEMEHLQQRVDDIMLGKVRYEGMYFQLDTLSGEYGDVPSGGEFAGPSLAYRKIELLERDPLFLAYLQHPVFREITRRVYGEDISIYRAMFMNKPAHRGTVLPYHQDAGSQWGLDRNPKITVWTALDDAEIDNGCIQVVPGSHKLGLLSEFGHTISAEQEAQHASDEGSVYLEAKTGEAILLDNLLLHRSGVNTMDRARRAFSVCYMDAATRSVRTPDRVFPRVFGREAIR